MAVPGYGHAGTAGQGPGQHRGLIGDRQGRPGVQARLAQGTEDQASIASQKNKAEDRHGQWRGQGRGQAWLAQGIRDQASIASQRDRAKDSMARAGDRHGCPRAQARLAQGTGYGQCVGQAQPEHGTGQGTGVAIPGNRHSWHKGQGKGQACPEQGIGHGTGITNPRQAGNRHGHPGPPADTPGDQPLTPAPLGEGAQPSPQGSSTGPSPTRAAAMSEQCPGLSPERGSLSTPGSRGSLQGLCPQSALSLQAPLRLRGRLRSSRRVDRSRRSDDVELRSPQLCRWIPSWGCSAPDQALQGTCNPWGQAAATGMAALPMTPLPMASCCTHPPVLNPLRSRAARRHTGQEGRGDRDGRGVHHAPTLAFGTGSFSSRPPRLRKDSGVP